MKNQIINPDKKCLGCHCKLEDKYCFCSITCACLCGYFSVRKGQIKVIKTITQEIRNKFLNNPPLRPKEENYL